MLIQEVSTSGFILPNEESARLAPGSTIMCKFLRAEGHEPGEEPELEPALVVVRPHPTDDVWAKVRITTGQWKNRLVGRRAAFSVLRGRVPDPGTRGSAGVQRQDQASVAFPVQVGVQLIEERELPGAGRQYCNDGLSDEGIFSGILDRAINRRESPLTGCR